MSFCCPSALRAVKRVSVHKITPQWQAARLPAQRLLPARTFTSSSPWLERKYTKEHEWIDLEPGATTGTVGISKFAANQLGDVVYVELPLEGIEIKQGDELGAVESVKSASDILTPISGTVTATNEALQDNPALINKDPEGDQGWIAKLDISEKGRNEFDTASKTDAGGGPEGLMTAEEYKKYTAETTEGE